MQKYNVNLFVFTKVDVSINVEANSLEEAKQIAEERCFDELHATTVDPSNIKIWEFTVNDVKTDSVEEHK